MKLRVNEICKQRGISMSELCNKIGIKQPNLSQSLKGNPTIGTLQAIADSLNVRLTELFEEPEENVNGFLNVNGEVRKILSAKDLIPIIGTFGVPSYVSYKVCKKDLKSYLRRKHDETKADSFAAILDGKILFTVNTTIICYDIKEQTKEAQFLVAVYKEGSKPANFLFEGYAFGDSYENIDYEDLLSAVWAEIIGCIDPMADYSEEEAEALALCL